ncbi:LptM family lipoprotein [Pedobacter endophyticus]|uniref:Uncharacterized protein n=1 Tax=Pedobacter endophyticus TaxID=2789740 RepID=A0A7S9Q0T0_9SPHI|nr:hypothetical protein [Pedobacter endophyticus]QPH41106.1 hypothetical protein IZT61_07550 [Pedobacter endophyticus]
MKKRLLILAMATAVALSSCKKKGPDDPPEPEEIKLEYSNLSVEVHKKNLEKNGTDFLALINTLPDEKFIDVLKYFIELDKNVPTYTAPFGSLFTIYEAAQGENIASVFEAAKTPNARNLSEFFAVYTWDPTEKKWIKTASANKLEIKFPADKNSKTNNAVLSFAYTASGIVSTFDGQKYTLPTSYVASLTVDNKEEMKLTSNHTYKADGNPTKADINVMMGSFNMAVLVTSDVKKVNSSLTLTKGKTSLLNLKNEANGNADINNAINATKINGILDNANTSFEIMNVRLAGVVDSKSVTTEYDALGNLSDEAKNKKKAEILNKYAEVYAAYKTENKIIAKVSFESIAETYTSSYWNGTDFVPETYIDYSIEPRLVFNDKSKVSLKAFTETGFSKLITDFENYGKRFE